MKNDCDLKIDWCSFEAAKYACTHYHYSKTLPAGDLIKVGVWEDDKFIGCVIFSRGTNNNIAKPYGLDRLEVCELTRVALRNHKSFVTQILSKAIKLLKSQCPGLKLIISYADGEQKHLGIIYQANNWIYEGEKDCLPYPIIINGKITHSRSVSGKYGTVSIEYLRQNVDPDAHVLEVAPKHKYLFPSDKHIKKQVLKLLKPYPKDERQTT